ncbi:MAG: hypothetical protein KAS83_03315, partial [Dehalococcoidia bacterium]|nr:hypothetical protein [Dehalococcoidia bacterium]
PRVKSKAGRIASSTRNTTARPILVAGPASEMSPTFLLLRLIVPPAVALGCIMTAPGAAKIKPKSEIPNATIKPRGHITYSAKQLNLLATSR